MSNLNKFFLNPKKLTTRISSLFLKNRLKRKRKREDFRTYLCQQIIQRTTLLIVKNTIRVEFFIARRKSRKIKLKLKIFLLISKLIKKFLPLFSRPKNLLQENFYISQNVLLIKIYQTYPKLISFIVL